MKNNNLYYLQLAYKNAQIAFLNNNVPVGAVITNKKEYISKQKNTNSRKKSFEHAELKCINDMEKLKINRFDCELFVTLTPCPMCSGAIYMHNIKKIYIGCLSNIKFYNEICGKLLYNHVFSGYLSLKCSKLLSYFFLVRR